MARLNKQSGQLRPGAIVVTPRPARLLLRRNLPTQFNNFAHTPHAKLANEKSWQGKVVGCESCHGPGKAHVDVINAAIDAGTDPTTIKKDDLKIRILKTMSPKQVSDTCLACHSGREEHNNYRRGEHWRNDVGCTDCHSAHDPDPSPPKAQSQNLLSENTRQ